MKTRRGLIRLKAGFLTAIVFQSLAQEPCAVDTWGLAHHIKVVRCTPTEYWTLPVDLDGDGTAEFHHARFDLIQFYYNGTRSFYETRDNREGFFAAEHVEVYAIRDWAVQTFISPELAPGRTILPNPPVGGDDWDRLWAFNPPFSLPYLQAYGLGFLRRLTDYRPCYEPITCLRQHWLGFLARAVDAREWEALAGFRIRKPDGWHLGWLLVEYRRAGPPGWPNELTPAQPRDGLAIKAWAIHPEPKQAIRAGEPPQPTLRAQRAGDAVTIAWHAAWTGWRLERRRELGAGTWEPVPDVTANTYTLPVADGPWLFRLVK